ncbi:FliM/FliN family flagellar motor switch protein [Roseateles amylovorans]|uniref:Flagellar motor switch protein FliN n=1 Tax=Roseateles amylovorans TaxID=2978473 RepID=A0ABY6B699_9BURK|nr:FliM/FliN family flagellar motor switch protein [Roseateles amylovorans]UXH80943.1 FliM/FliN family flagellar motor switch protein [Roseateles amylovorans]
MMMSDDDLIAGLLDQPQSASPAPVEPRPAGRDLPALMRKIAVTLTLEVGEARLSLHDLAQLRPDSVVELDTLAGAPLVIKVNGTAIGHAEVVVSGDSHALRVLDIDGLNLDALDAPGA